jgi:hypothetical protein
MLKQKTCPQVYVLLRHWNSLVNCTFKWRESAFRVNSLLRRTRKASWYTWSKYNFSGSQGDNWNMSVAKMKRSIIWFNRTIQEAGKWIRFRTWVGLLENSSSLKNRYFHYYKIGGYCQWWNEAGSWQWAPAFCPTVPRASYLWPVTGMEPKIRLKQASPQTLFPTASFLPPIEKSICKWELWKRELWER